MMPGRFPLSLLLLAASPAALMLPIPAAMATDADAAVPSDVVAEHYAAQLEANGLRVPLEADALKELKKDHPEFFVTGLVKTIGDKVNQSNPVRPHRGVSQRSQLTAEGFD